MHAIYLTDLALRYFPRSSARSAVTQLRRWIVLNKDLQKNLMNFIIRKDSARLRRFSTRRYVISWANPKLINNE